MYHSKDINEFAKCVFMFSRLLKHNHLAFLSVVYGGIPEQENGHQCHGKCSIRRVQDAIDNVLLVSP